MIPFRSIDEVPLPSYDEGEVVAVKLHMGERGNATYVRPSDVARLVGRIKESGAELFIADTTTLYQRKRATVEAYKETARLHGFTMESIGCPVVIADSDGGTRVGRVSIAKGLLKADKLLVFSHATAHITTGFAGAIKNVAMGCTAKDGKRYIHSAGWPRYDEEACVKCEECVEACPFGFIALKDGIRLNLKNCPACERCLNACKNGGLWRPQEAIVEGFARYAETCKAVISSFSGTYFINELNRVARYCDCSSKVEPIISPDLGFIAGEDPVEIDKESVRIISEASREASEAFGDRWSSFIENVSARM